MTAELVGELLDELDAAAVPWWIAGGWGIDSLVGRQTRDHRDLDLLYPIEHDVQLRRVLTDRGYNPETDWWPVRVEFAGPSYVDIHPLRFAADGSAVQAGLDGTEFSYPASAFALGQIGGRVVSCLSVAQQRLFHSGYELRDVDRLDLAHLDQIAADRQGRH
jgi:lincosamide nucleotidyltransferase A/C/D/E